MGLREEARLRAEKTYGDFVGIVLSAAADDRPAVWHVLDFHNAHVLAAWFRDASIDARNAYVASFDKTSDAWSRGEPAAENQIGDSPSSWIGARRILTGPEKARLASGPVMLQNRGRGGDYGTSWGLDWTGPRREIHAGASWPQARALIRAAIKDVHDFEHGLPVGGVTQVEPRTWPAYFWQLGANGVPSVSRHESYADALALMRVVTQPMYVSEGVATALFDRSNRHWPNPVAWHQSDLPEHEEVIAAYLHGGTTHVSGATVDQRAEALRRAMELGARHVGVVLWKKPATASEPHPEPWWATYTFPSYPAAVDWYQEIVGAPTGYAYLALFDKEDPHWADGRALAEAPTVSGKAAAWRGSRRGDIIDGMSNSRDPWRAMQSSPPAWAAVAPIDDDGNVAIVGHHGGGGHGGGWHGGGRGRRRFFGDYGYSYPYWYDYPYDVNVYVVPEKQIPAAQAQQQQEAVASGVTWLGALAPVVAPAASGIAVCLKLGANQQLHATLCVDGRCYESHIDITPFLAALEQRLAAWHDRAHAAHAASLPPDFDRPPALATVSGADPIVQRAIDDGAIALVGSMLEQHEAIMLGSFFDDIGNAFTGVVNTIGNALKPLEPIVKTAASLGATAIGGPAAGALAGSLITGALANAGPKKDAAKQQVAAAKQQAATRPDVALALKDAHKVAAQTMGAYHVVNQVKNAASGDPKATAEVKAIFDQASKGDSAAQWAKGVATSATSAAAANAASDSQKLTDAEKANIEIDPAPADLQQADTAAVASGAVPVILFVAAALGGYAWWRSHRGRAHADAAIATAAQADAAEHPADKVALHDQAMQHAAAAQASSPPAAPGEAPPDLLPPLEQMVPPGLRQAAATAAGAEPLTAIRKHASDLASASADRVIGVMIIADGSASTVAFASSDTADDWFGGAVRDPKTFVYAAYYDKGDPTFPSPLNEAVGHAKKAA